MSDPRKLSNYVEPELSDARLDAQWSRIGERLPAPRRRSTWQLVSATGFVLAAAAAVVWLQVETPRESAWEGSVVSSDEAPVEMTLSEGSLVELAPRSEVELLHSTKGSVALRLGDGSARFSVSKRSARRFSVRSGPIEVVATDTQFRITRLAQADGEHVRVDVESGSAEVRRRDDEPVALRLVQGEHWSTFVAYEKSAAPIDEVVRMKPAPKGADETGGDDVLDEQERAAEVVNPPDGRRARRARPTPPSPADDLFDRANIARRAGQLRDAEALYAELVQRFPRDNSAALAAFELGRIRMDALKDLPGAVRAFDRALSLDSRRAFAEDALARLALAHAGLGDMASCRREKERYLKRYPEGVHANILAGRCPSP